ncbi:hypothetical protein [Rhizobium mongolense]|uniref:Uncharacterized protein n=1 Tax=Rhizobium mongolense TaxID=57676 RepID=A0A7W6RVL0_9HYPH|nr:hypothetical protein [Rhizobium mongolense]MBB4279460.1 hypothetical protein [Rhizobium mongolense]
MREAFIWVAHSLHKKGIFLRRSTSGHNLIDRLEQVRTGDPWFAHRFENVISTVFAGEQIGAMVRPFGIHLEKADHLLYMMRDD